MNITQRDPLYDDAAEECKRLLQKIQDFRTRSEAFIGSMPPLTPEETRQAIDGLLARKDIRLSEMTREALRIMRDATNA
jgi:hypothetical protein